MEFMLNLYKDKVGGCMKFDTCDGKSDVNSWIKTLIISLEINWCINKDGSNTSQVYLKRYYLDNSTLILEPHYFISNVKIISNKD